MEVSVPALDTRLRQEEEYVLGSAVVVRQLHGIPVQPREGWQRHFAVSEGCHRIAHDR